MKLYTTRALTQEEIDLLPSRATVCYPHGNIINQVVELPAYASQQEARQFGRVIAADAYRLSCDHFHCDGIDPRVAWWANFYAGVSHWGNQSIKVHFDPSHVMHYPSAGLEGMLFDKPMTVVFPTEKGWVSLF